jgi:hypothetical protein
MLCSLTTRTNSHGKIHCRGVVASNSESYKGCAPQARNKVARGKRAAALAPGYLRVTHRCGDLEAKLQRELHHARVA